MALRENYTVEHTGLPIENTDSWRKTRRRRAKATLPSENRAAESKPAPRENRGAEKKILPGMI